jgi:acetoacetyl-CoA synthetase
VTVAEGELLWTPSATFAAQSNLGRYMRWLEGRGRTNADYEALRRWSVAEPDAFWSSLWDFFDVRSTQPYGRVVTGTMPDARWFTGSRVNFTEHVLRHEAARRNEGAVLHRGEVRSPEQMTWGELGTAVRNVATALRARGIRPGDRVVSYMPNIAETVIAMLATAAIGATFASAAPEFGPRFVIERFEQIAPKAIFVADGYRFGGKAFDRSEEVRAIVAGLPTLELVVTLPYLNAVAGFAAGGAAASWAEMVAEPSGAPESFAYAEVGEEHPLWILFSSGTTGLPKAIVHSHVGILLECYKNLGFHANLGPASTMFFYTTTGWMMWNALLSSLLLGAKIVLYDGHPMYPGPDLLWSIAAESKATCFGSSPTFVKQMRDHGLVPGKRFDLAPLQSIFLSGSPSTPETFAWLYENVKPDFWVTSQSGGTEFCSGLVVGVPILPVYAGEIQARTLGIDVRVWDDAGRDLVEGIGELVVTAPSPSMPLYLWNDPGGARYRASYFDRYPGVWRHGDFAKINARGGCYVYGRSDATLNRFGVRIGSAEIYRALEELGDVADSLIVCLELPNGDFFMPLFVRPASGATLDAALKTRIVAHLRQRCSPRHVPDEIHAVPAIPYTLSSKKMEIPVRRILAGFDPTTVVDRESLADPASLDWFVRFAHDAPQLAAFRSSPGGVS